MADRFPSLEDLDTGAVPSTAPTSQNPTASEDPTSDFLAREAALLGDDAAQFSTPGDKKAAAPSSRQPALVEQEEGESSDDDDLLGGGSGTFAPKQELYLRSGDEEPAFESRFPAADDGRNNNVGAGGTITGSNLPLRSVGQSYADEEEPEVIQQWRETRDAQIAKRAEISQKKRESTLKAAQAAIDEFYESYNNKKDKSIAQTRREAEAFINSRQDTTSGGTSWQRIAKLVDLNAPVKKGGKDADVGGIGGGAEKEQFRALLRDLAKDEKAPGAGGV